MIHISEKDFVDELRKAAFDEILCSSGFWRDKEYAMTFEGDGVILCSSSGETVRLSARSDHFLVLNLLSENWDVINVTWNNVCYIIDPVRDIENVLSVHCGNEFYKKLKSKYPSVKFKVTNQLRKVRPRAYQILCDLVPLKNKEEK